MECLSSGHCSSRPEASGSTSSNNGTSSVRVFERISCIAVVQLLELLEPFELGLLLSLVFLDLVEELIEFKSVLDQVVLFESELVLVKLE